MELAAWLRSLSLERYEPVFRQHEIDPEVLPDLTEADLEKLGLPLGPRKKLLRAIAALRSEPIATNAAIGAPAPTSAAILSPERRQLTCMFIDLVGSTPLAAKLDPEEMRELLRAYQNTVAGEIARLGGHVAKFMGDGVLGYFGWPRTHEDATERAVRAGLAIVDAVAGLTTPSGDSLAARIGIATGLVVVGDLIGEGAAREEAVVGETPNLAARLQAQAAPSEVVIAEQTRRLLGALFEVEDLGERAIHGFAKLVRAYRVCGEGQAESRFQALHGISATPLIGREHELAWLLKHWDQARAGTGQVVLLIGEAGIGKSRITRALINAADLESDCVLRYQCSPQYPGSPLWPVVRQLERAAGFADGDTAAAKLGKLEAQLGPAAKNVGETVALVAGMAGLEPAPSHLWLDLNPRSRRARLLEALATQLTHQQPVLVVVEDAHWIDPTTLELIDLAAGRIANSRVFIIVTSRLDDQPQLVDRSYLTRLILDRLAPADAAVMIARLAGDRELSPAVVSAIMQRSDGVPLFVEELTKAVLEAGKDDAPLVPASLHDSLLARLDRLPEAKKIAQAAACIGREFDCPLLAKAAGVGEHELQTALDQLVDAGLVFRRNTALEARYCFKHALVRDAAYESLLRSSRKEVHRAIAETLRGIHDTKHDTKAAPEVVAYHCREAGDLETAMDYLLLAGQRAAERSADVEATGYLRDALAMVARIPDSKANRARELELLLALSGPLIATRGYAAPETMEVFERARRLCEALDDRRRLFPVLYGQWLHFHTGLAKGALPAAERYMELAKRDGGAVPLLTGHRLMSLALCCRGCFAEALAEAKAGLALYNPGAHRELCLAFGQDPYVPLMSIGVAWNAWFLGAVGQSREASAAALQRARDLRHLNTMAYALHMTAIRAWFERAVGEVLELSGELVALAEAHAMPLWLTWGRMLLAWARMRNGGGPEQLERMRETLREITASGHLTFRPFHLSMLAEAACLAGEAELARAAVEEAADVIGRIDERFWEPELYRQRGELLSGVSLPAAEAALEMAATLARERQAGSLELRTAISLSRLWSARDEMQRAHLHLTSVYARFVEEVETPDRREAKQLLDSFA